MPDDTETDLFLGVLAASLGIIFLAVEFRLLHDWLTGSTIWPLILWTIWGPALSAGLFAVVSWTFSSHA